MESEESCEDFVEALPSDRSSVGLMTNGTVSLSPRPMKAEQIYQTCGDFQHENLVSCSSAPPNLMPMGATAIFNQAGQLQPGLVAMQDPNMPDQLMVVQQSMNGGIEDSPHKATLINAQGSIPMTKFSNGQLQSINPGMLQHITTNAAGQMIATTPQLANMMNLAGLPQISTLNGQTINVLNQMTGQTTQIVQQQQPGNAQQQQQIVQQQQAANAQQQQQQIVQQAVNAQQQQIVQQAVNAQQQQIVQQAMNAQQQQIVQQAVNAQQQQQIVQNPQMQGMVVNGHPNAVQQQGQVGNNPQYILSGGQPMQGIQGTQLLIPTSSGVVSGVAAQQVITIPVNQLAGNQLVQLVASNGQIFTTTLANLQAMSQPGPSVNNQNMTGNHQAVQSHPMLAPGFANMQQQIAPMPQIFTNAAGQLVTLGPQVMTHQMMGGNPQNIMMNPQMAAQLQQQVQQQQAEDKSLATVSSSGQPMNRVVQNSSLNAITQAIAMQQQQQQQQSGQMTLNPLTIVTTVGSPKNGPNTQNCLVAPKLQLQPGSTVSTLTQTLHPQPSVSPDDDCDNALNQISTISNTEANVVDGINLEEIKDFAKAFKIRRLSLGLTQTQVGMALSATEGPSYSQSAICRFEKLDITPRSAQKIKPVLEQWMQEAEERYKNGSHTLTEFIGSEPTKKRKRRTSFTPSALDLLNQFFEKNTHPSGLEMTALAEHLNYDREVVRVWFCNKRQALKNTIKKLKT